MASEPRSAISDSPSEGAAALRAAPSRSTAALKKRNQRDWSDNDSRKARNRPTSSIVDGRTCTVEPSRSALSVSATTWAGGPVLVMAPKP